MLRPEVGNPVYQFKNLSVSYWFKSIMEEEKSILIDSNYHPFFLSLPDTSRSNWLFPNKTMTSLSRNKDVWAHDKSFQNEQKKALQSKFFLP